MGMITWSMCLCLCVCMCVCACAGAWSWRLVEDANEAKKCRQLSLRVDQYG